MNHVVTEGLTQACICVQSIKEGGITRSAALVGLSLGSQGGNQAAQQLQFVGLGISKLLKCIEQVPQVFFLATGIGGYNCAQCCPRTKGAVVVTAQS